MSAIPTSKPTGVESQDLETWQNAGRSRVIIKKFAHSGELVDHIIKGQAKLTLTSHERRLNQEMAADSDWDPFNNGTFIPVRLIETAEDLEQIKSNPNLMSEEDMRELLNKHFKQVKSRLADIKSEAVLNRLSEIAREEDVSVGKMEAIQARLQDFKPDFMSEQGDGLPERPQGVSSL